MRMGRSKTTFKKGDQAARGKGPKQGTGGRPTNAAVKRLLHMLDDAEKGKADPLNGDKDKISIYEKALRNVRDALWEREDGLMTPACERMTREVIAYIDGPPAEKHEHSGKVEIVVTYE